MGLHPSPGLERPQGALKSKVCNTACKNHLFVPIYADPGRDAISIPPTTPG